MAKVMEATINEDKKHRCITVVVEHENWQSFSRAVIPRAKKEFRRWVSENIMFGDLAHVASSLGGEYIRDSKTRCISTLTFTY